MITHKSKSEHRLVSEECKESATMVRFRVCMALPVRFRKNGDVTKPLKQVVKVCLTNLLLRFLIVLKGSGPVNFDVTDLAFRHLVPFILILSSVFLSSSADGLLNGGG